MIVLHATTEQYNQLNGYSNKASVLEFVQDKLDRWVVGVGVLDDPNFEEIKPQLEELERIEYLPK